MPIGQTPSLPGISQAAVTVLIAAALAAAEAYADAGDIATLAAAEAYTDAKLPRLVAWGSVNAAGVAYYSSFGCSGVPVLNGTGDWLINLTSSNPRATTLPVVSANGLGNGYVANIDRQTNTQYRVETSIGVVANSNIDFTFFIYSTV